MGFLVDIDPYAELPTYEMVLCKLNEEPIMTIENYIDFEYQAFFASIDELSFKIPKFRYTETGEKIPNERYEAIDGDHLILVNNETFFYIHYAKETFGEDGEVFKEVQAYSREYELSQKKIMGYKGVSRRIYTLPVHGEEAEKDEDGLFIGFLNYVESISSWRVGYVDNDIMNKYRTLEFSDTNILNTFQEIQKTFGCLLRFDTINRKINVYEATDFESDSGLYISDKNFLKSIEKTIQSDEIKTRLYLYGNENISVQPISITGKPYIENYKFYKTPKYMSRELIQALDRYENAIKSEEGLFKSYLEDLEQKQLPLQQKTDQLVEDMNNIREQEIMLDTIMARPYETNEDRNKALAEQRKKIEELEKKKRTTQRELEVIEREVNNIYRRIESLRARIERKSEFNEELARELDSFIREDSYTETAYQEDNREELLEEGYKILNRISQPQIQFDASIIDFLSLVEHQHSWNKLKLGDKVHLYHEELNFDYYVRLVSYVHSPDSNQLSLKFSSTGTLDDPSLYIRDLMDEFKTASNNVDFNKYKWDKGEKAESDLTNYIDNNLDLAKQALETANGQVTVLDHRGYWGTKLNEDGTTSPEKLRMTNNLIAMTKDDWQTVDVAISPTLGINANLINGQIGNFATINADQIIAGKLQSRDKSTWISLDDGSFNFKNSLLWKDNELEVKGHITSSTIAIGEKFKVDKYGNMTAKDALFEGDIIGASSIKIGEKFSVDSRGNMTAKNATFEGDIEGASSIKIGEKFSVDRRGNLTARGAKLEGDLIAGTININDKFRVDSRGRMVAEDGVFRGRMEAVDIYGGTISIGRYFSVDKYGEMYAKNATFQGTIRGSSINIGLGKYIFKVEEDGEMYARNATFEGTIKSSKIIGGEINGALLRTAETGKNRIELTKNSLSTLNANNIRHGISMEIGRTHNALVVYDNGARKGIIEYTKNDYDPFLNDKLWIKSDANTPLKLEAGFGANMSISSSRTIYFDAQQLHFSSVSQVAYLQPYKFKGNGAYSGSFKVGNKTVKVVNGFITSVK